MDKIISKTPFWRVVPDEREDQYLLPVLPGAQVGHDRAQHIMGGVALGAIVDAMEIHSGLPLQYAHIQFLSPTNHAEELKLTCEQCGGGRAVAQYAGTASVNGRPTHRASAALGRRDPSEFTQFVEMPDVPPPEESTLLTHGEPGSGSLIDQFEMRVAHADPEKALKIMWTRSTAGFPVDAGWLAIVSDFFLGAHPIAIQGSSLDAMLRFIQGAEPGWVLSCVQLTSFEGGVAHGSARHFSQDGRLLAISSQSGVLPRNPIL